MARSIEKTKEIMIDALVGLALGLGAYVLLANVNPNTLSYEPLEIFMINRVSFYNVIYCKDITGASSLNYMHAGPPDKPKDYMEQLRKEGFKYDLSKTQCGTEYYIEGGDASGVCMGMACKGGGMCMNCATKLPECKTNSSLEHVCTECKMGGGVAAHEKWRPVNVGYYLFCTQGDPDDVNKFEVVDTALLAEYKFDWEESNEVSSGNSSGYVGSICVGDTKGDGRVAFEMNKQQILDFGKMCTDNADISWNPSNNRLSGMVMLVHLNQDVTLDIHGASSLKDYFAERGASPSISWLFNPVAPIYEMLLRENNWDQYYYMMNKKMCNKNLRGVSLAYNQTDERALYTSEEAAFKDGVEIFWKAAFNQPGGTEDIFDYFFDDGNAWSIKETADFRENGMPGPCGFNVQIDIVETISNIIGED